MTVSLVLAALTVTSMVTRDGRRVVSRDGGRTFGQVATNVVPADVAPVRPWKIYVVKATHADIGLHNSQYIQRHGAVKRIEDAMRLIDADRRPDDDPAAYRYVMEGVWFWENYPMDRGESAAWNVISNYVRRGRIDIACGCAGNHTHVMGPEELRRLALAKTRLEGKWGVPTRTAIFADNPGISWSAVKPFAEAGVENIVFAPNQWNPIPSTLRKPNLSIPGATWNPDARGGGSYIDVSYDSERPMVFRWESFDRSTNLLVWCSTQYDGGLARVGIGPGGGDLKTVEGRMPGFLATLERKYPYDVWLACDYCDDEEANTRFADFAARWNAKWAVPQFVTVGRLDEPFDELRKRFGDSIPVVRGEMTSGWLQHVISAPDLLAAKLSAERGLSGASGREADCAWWQLVLNDEHSYGVSGYQGRRVFETWMQRRDWIERAARAGKRDEVKGKRDEVRGPGENEWYKIVVNEKGEIESIYDKDLGWELLKETANKFLYTRDNHKTWSDETFLGAKITRKVFLAADEKRIDIEDRFEHATDLFNAKRYYRYGYIAFPFNVPEGEFRAQLGGGEVIDPYRDQSGYATDAYVAVRDWCAVENDAFGVALRQWDTVLTEFGEIHPDKTCFTGLPPKDKSGIYSYAFTDWLQLHVPDGESISFTLRYAITSYSSGNSPLDGSRAVARPALSAANFPDSADDGWTGLLDAPRASHGEKDGQLYLLWGADLSSAFSHYELYRNGVFLTNVFNEAPGRLPYRVARYEDVGLATHAEYAYRIRKVMKDGAKGDLSLPFVGRTRAVFDTEAIESEGLRVEVNRNGGCVTSWCPQGGTEVLSTPRRARWGEEDVHGGILVCWPWVGKPPHEGQPQDGIARYAKWTLEERIGKSGMRWSLESTPETMKLWPHAFRLDYRVEAVGRELRLRLRATNTGKSAFDATAGFHPYFKVADACKVSVNGRPNSALPCALQPGESKELELKIEAIKTTFH